MDWMPQAIREGIFTILFISGPLVVLAAGLGLTIGVIQAATQVQEQTLGSAVKIIGLFIALIVFGFYMFQYMSKYASQNVERAFKLVPTLGAKALPRRNFLEIPKEEEQEAINAVGLEEHHAPPKKSKGHAPSINEPLAHSVNENVKPERLAPPASQTRPNPDIDAVKKQELKVQEIERKIEAKKPATKPSPAAIVQKPKPAPVQQKAEPTPVVTQPKTTTAPVTKKPARKRLKRSSASDRLSKLRSLGGQ